MSQCPTCAGNPGWVKCSKHGWDRCRDCSEQLTHLITWVNVETELPDSDTTVLIVDGDNDVFAGFLDGDLWRYESGDRVASGVLYWADLPPSPKNNKS